MNTMRQAAWRRAARRWRPACEALEGRRLLNGRLDADFGEGGTMRLAFDVGASKNDEVGAMATDPWGRA